MLQLLLLSYWIVNQTTTKKRKINTKSQKTMTNRSNVTTERWKTTTKRHEMTFKRNKMTTNDPGAQYLLICPWSSRRHMMLHLRETLHPSQLGTPGQLMRKVGMIVRLLVLKSYKNCLTLLDNTTSN